MKRIDLNCDMGEGIGNDEAIMPWINSANIACGFHAGSSEIMKKTIDLALRYGVKVGAHPSFRDRANFGRQEITLPNDKVYALIMEQIIKLDLIAREKGATLHHVKPHGALYNMAARDRNLALTIVQAIQDFDPGLVLYGLSGSYLIHCAEELGLPCASEVFADRTYNEDGSLVSRSRPGALIENDDQALAQVKMLLRQSKVISITGKEISLRADTICIHGDGKHAAQFAEKLYFATQPQQLG